MMLRRFGLRRGKKIHRSNLCPHTKIEAWETKRLIKQIDRTLELLDMYWV